MPVFYTETRETTLVRVIGRFEKSKDSAVCKSV